MKIDIVGGGIAGFATARALVRSGHKVRIFDPSPPPSPGDTVLVAGIFKPVLSTTNTPQTRLSFPALRQLTDELIRLQSAGFSVPHSQEGLLQCAKSADEERRFRKAQTTMEPRSGEWREPEAVRELLGIRSEFGGILWTRGGWVSPLHLFQAWKQEMERSPKGTFELIPEAYPLDPTQWHTQSDAVVICAGPASHTLPDFDPARYQLIRGQISVLDFGEELPPFLPSIAHEYIVPLGAGRFVIGATHDRDDLGTDVRPQDHERLLERFGAFLPEAWAGRDELQRPVFMRAGTRFTTSTRLPYVGKLPRSTERAGRPVYAFTGLGSRGILWSVLLGEVLSTMISGNAPALESDLLGVLSV